MWHLGLPTASCQGYEQLKCYAATHWDQAVGLQPGGKTGGAAHRSLWGTQFLKGF